jgi:hypothetical protein
MILNFIRCWTVQRIKNLKLVCKFVEEFFNLIHLFKLLLLILILGLTAFIEVFVNIAEVSELIKHLIFELLVDGSFRRFWINFIILILLIRVNLFTFC